MMILGRTLKDMQASKAFRTLNWRTLCRASSVVTPTITRVYSTAPTDASSVRDSEIEHFSRLSSEWWNEKGEFGLLHVMNPSRVQFIREKLTEVVQHEDTLRASQKGKDGSDAALPVRFLQGKDVIDVGCGGGLLSEVRAPSLCLYRNLTESVCHT